MRWSPGWRWVVIAGMALGLGASELADGTLHLVCENALRWRPAGRAHGRAHDDLTVDLHVRDGRVAASGWAFVRATPGIEHPVRVDTQELADHRLRLTMTITVLPQYPYLSGGDGRVSCDLLVDGPDLRGSYRCEWTARDPAAAQAAARVADVRPAFRGGLQTGTSTSVVHVAAGGHWGVAPVLARGTITPVPPSRTARGDRLWVGGDDVRAAARGEAADAVIDQLRTAATAAVPSKRCAAVAALVACGMAPPADLGAAVTACLQQLPERRGLALARALLALAAAAAVDPDAVPGDHPEVTAALHAIAAQDGGARLFGAELAPWPDHAYEPVLVSLRAAAGTLALVLDGPELAPVRAVGARSVRRFLDAAIGESGSGPGLPWLGRVLVPVGLYLQARQAHDGVIGEAHRAYARAAAWQVTGDGIALAATPVAAARVVALAAPWLDPAATTIAATWQPYLHAAAVDPLVAVPVLTAARRFAPATAPDAPTVRYDQTMGALVLRRDWAADTFIALVQSGAPWPQAGAISGRFALRGAGRDWVALPRVGDQGLTPLAPWRQNTLQIRQGPMASLRPCLPARGGRGVRVRSGDGAWASLGIRGAAYRTTDAGGRPAPLEGEKKTPYHWRTVGIDVHPASGAEAVVVVVGGSFGTADRERVWSLDLGPVGLDEVTTAVQTFTVRPAGSAYVLQGRFLFPSTVELAVVPGDAHGGTRIEASLKPPRTPDAVLFAEQVDDAVDDLSIGRARVPAATDLDTIELELVDEESDARDALARLERTVFTKIERVTTSTSMGAPTLRQRVRNHAVCVLTVSRGAPPPVEVLPREDPDLLTIGRRRVRYWEYLVEFHAEDAR